jgi:ribosomal protein S18 acetylase RimI-like enzyme
MRRDAIRSAYAGGRDEIIMLDGQPAGWLVTAELPEEIRLAEIMVSVEKRGMGVGTAVLRGVLAHGERTGKPVRLTVRLTNPGAERLYQRLGFRRIDADELNATLEWRSGSGGVGVAQVRHEL